MKVKRAKLKRIAVCSACGYQPATISVAFCPGCGCSFVPAEGSPKRIGWLSVPAMLYQTAYKWFVAISAIDLVLTWFIITLGGNEVNVIADAVIAQGGLSSVLIYKFCLVVLVVLICEVVGRRRFRTGRNLARAAVAITTVPVVLSIAQLLLP